MKFFRIEVGYWIIQVLLTIQAFQNLRRSFVEVGLVMNLKRSKRKQTRKQIGGTMSHIITRLCRRSRRLWHCCLRLWRRQLPFDSFPFPCLSYVYVDDAHLDACQNDADDGRDRVLFVFLLFLFLFKIFRGSSRRGFLHLLWLFVHSPSSPAGWLALSLLSVIFTGAHEAFSQLLRWARKSRGWTHCRYSDVIC